MDPRTFLAPIQCNLCNLLLYTLTDVSRHCSYHATIDFICHHCMVHFDSKAVIAAHMNEKGAHLRPPFNPTTYDSALLSPASSASAVLPLSQPAPPPVPASPIPAVATLSDVSLDQLLRDIDTSTVAGTDVSASSISPPQVASSQLSSPDVSPTVGARPKTSVSYPPAEYRQLRQQNTEQKFLLWWCLHHLKSLPTPPPSAGAEFDMALRRVLQQTAVTPSQFDENSSFTDTVNQLYDLHVGTVTKFP